MSITVFGIVWLAMLLICFFRNEVKYMITITLLSMVFQSASVVVMGTAGVGPQVPTSIAMVIWNILHSSVWTSGKIKITKGNKICKYSFLGIMGLASVIVISRRLNINNYQMENLKYILLFLQIVIYFICYMSMWTVKNQITEGELSKIFIGIICFVACIGMIQLLTTIGVIPRNDFFETFLYTPDTDSAYYWYDYYPRVFSTFMEPSYCGTFLVGAFYYLVSLEKMDRFHIVLSLILVGEIALTLSSTAYGAFAVCGIIYVILSRRKKALKYLVPIAIFVVIILMATGELQEVLDTVIFSKGESGSAVTRANWDREAVAVFNESPLWGYGYKNVRASQFLLSIAGQIGVVGCIAWFVVWIPVIVNWWGNKNNHYLTAIVLCLAGVIIAMFIAIPDIDNVSFWQCMYMCALTSNIVKYNKNNGVSHEIDVPDFT